MKRITPIQNFAKFDFIPNTDIKGNTLLAYMNTIVCCEKYNNDIVINCPNGGGQYSVYLGNRYFCLLIDIDTRRIGGIVGDYQIKDIANSQITLPKSIKECVLQVDTIHTLNVGCGSYIEFDYKVSYDKQNGILQIGNITQDKPIYKFLHNAYCQLDNGKLIGLLLSNILI